MHECDLNLFAADRRQGYCFTNLLGGRCVSHSAPLGMTTKGRCCCALAAAWGPRCEKCPQQGTGELYTGVRSVHNWEQVSYTGVKSVHNREQVSYVQV